MASWKLAPALDRLFKDINAKWPNRDKSTDGTLGDASHSARKSEHNPNRDPSDDVPDGYVTAGDIDKDGINVKRVLNVLIGDHRVWYVIHNGTIWSRTYGWAPRKYTGSNPHTGHIHVSLVQAKAKLNSTASWNFGAAAKPAPTPEKPKYEKLASGVKINKRHEQVKLLQRLLIKAGYGPIRGSVTTLYGRNTQAAVARFHKKNPQFASKSYDVEIGPKGFQHLQEEAEKA